MPAPTADRQDDDPIARAREYVDRGEPVPASDAAAVLIELDDSVAELGRLRSQVVIDGDPPPPDQAGAKVDLTVRQYQVLQLVAIAYTNRQIAHRLGMEELTVKSTMQSLFQKLGAVSRLDAVNKAADAGIIVWPTSRTGPGHSAELHERGIELIVLKQGADTTIPVGRFTFQTVAAMDAFLAARGRRSGSRRLALTAEQDSLARQMYYEKGADGKFKHTVAAIAGFFGVSRKTIYCHLGDAERRQRGTNAAETSTNTNAQSRAHG